jgi:hypothetical protein
MWGFFGRECERGMRSEICVRCGIINVLTLTENMDMQDYTHAVECVHIKLVSNYYQNNNNISLFYFKKTYQT